VLKVLHLEQLGESIWQEALFNLCSEFQDHLDDTFGPNGLVLGSPVRSRVLGSRVLTDPIRLEMFCDSMILCLSSQSSRICLKKGNGKTHPMTWSPQPLMTLSLSLAVEHPDKMANDQGTVPSVCRLFYRGGGRASHLGCTPGEAGASVIINLVNEVLLGRGCCFGGKDVNFQARKLFCLFSEGPIKMSSFFV